MVTTIVAPAAYAPAAAPVHRARRASAPHRTATHRAPATPAPHAHRAAPVKHRPSAPRSAAATPPRPAPPYGLVGVAALLAVLGAGSLAVTISQLRVEAT